MIEKIEENEIYYYRGERVINIIRKLSPKFRLPEWLDPSLAADVFYIFYLPFPKITNKYNNIKYIIIKNIINNALLWRIKPYTSADRIASFTAAAVFLDSLLKSLGSEISINKNIKNKFKNTKENKGQSEGVRDNSGERISSSVANALRNAYVASKNARSVQQLLAKTGFGGGSGLEFEDSLEDIIELAKSTDVSRILEFLKAINVSRFTSRQTIATKKGWIRGIDIGGDIERIHYSRLAFPEELFLAELANSRLLLFEKELFADTGAIYVLLDKSGSMSGIKIDWARAVALALFLKARGSRRRFFVRFFDSTVYDLVSVGRRIRRSDVLRLVKYLGTVKSSGGTDITGAISRAVEDLRSGRVKGVSDIVLITDGEDKLSLHVIEGILGSADVRLHVVAVGGDNECLRDIAFKYYRVERLDEKNILKILKF